MDPDQTAPLGAVWSGSTLFAYMQNVSLKSLQEDAADNISRRHFQMKGYLVTFYYGKCPKISNIKVSDKMANANNADPEQTAPEEAVWSGSTLFAILLF